LRSFIEIGPYLIEEGMDRTEAGALAANASAAVAAAAFATGDILVDIFDAALDIFLFFHVFIVVVVADDDVRSVVWMVGVVEIID
jgi:uncharacterized MAPEG superfamily protein